MFDLPDESPHPPEGETFPVEYQNIFCVLECWAYIGNIKSILGLYRDNGKWKLLYSISCLLEWSSDYPEP